jgi:outer membrane protein TolC
LAVLSYTNGVATQLTVSQAATQYEQAQLALYNAMYDYRAACYDWEIITGLLQE